MGTFEHIRNVPPGKRAVEPITAGRCETLLVGHTRDPHATLDRLRGNPFAQIAVGNGVVRYNPGNASPED